MNTTDNQKKLKKKRWLIGIFVLIFTLFAIIITGFCYESIAAKSGKAAFPMPGKLVDTGSYGLHLNIQGSGPLTIVMESGSGESSISWGNIPQSLSSYATVVSYDRGGYAWSEKATTARSGENIVKELHTALQKEGLNGPYLLVGHSLGGMYTRLFAQTYPKEVAGLVLVDARPEDDSLNTAAIYAKEKFQEKPSAFVLSLLKSSGILRIFQDELLGEMVAKEKREIFLNIIGTKNYFYAVEEEGKLAGDVEDAIRAQDLGDLPVKVIARGLAPDYQSFGISEQAAEQIEKIWREGQYNMLHISTDSELIIAENSGHMVMEYEPEIIKNTILELLQSIGVKKETSLSLYE